MTLFSAPDEPWSHRARIVLAEKELLPGIEIIDVLPGRFPEDLYDLNPYHSVPTLVDRDLVLYDSRVIIEYLDERFPHPPLMPVDPVARAQVRLALYRIERDWYGLMTRIEREEDLKAQVKLRKDLRDTVHQAEQLFGLKPFFLSDEFSLMDATIAPVLWRLQSWEGGLVAPAVLRYAAAVFSRPSFRDSLSEVEAGMSPPPATRRQGHHG